MQAMGVEAVQMGLDALGLDTRVMIFAGSTATSGQAAARVGCELGAIVKSLGFMIKKSQPVLALVSGDQMMDERKLAALFQVGRKQARMMTPAQCLEILGYAPGSVPPIALRQADIAIYLDQTLRRYDTVHAAGGAANALFPIKLDALQAVTKGQFADLARA